MTLAVLKKWFDKMYVWCVQHWRWLVLSFLVLLAYLAGNKRQRSLRVEASLAKKQYKKEVEAIESEYKAAEERKRKVEERYQKSLKQLDKKYNDVNSKLEREKDKEYKRLLKEAKKDPAKLDSLLKDMGITEV